jgi:hypothetical protein
MPFVKWQHALVQVAPQQLRYAFSLRCSPQSSETPVCPMSYIKKLQSGASTVLLAFSRSLVAFGLRESDLTAP